MLYRAEFDVMVWNIYQKRQIIWIPCRSFVVFFGYVLQGNGAKFVNELFYFETKTGNVCTVTANQLSLTSSLLATTTVASCRRFCQFYALNLSVHPREFTGGRPSMGVPSRMIPTEDASARKREIEEKLKQVRHIWTGRKHHTAAFSWNILQTWLHCRLIMLFLES